MNQPSVIEFGCSLYTQILSRLQNFVHSHLQHVYKHIESLQSMCTLYTYVNFSGGLPQHDTMGRIFQILISHPYKKWHQHGMLGLMYVRVNVWDGCAYKICSIEDTIFA